jgi:hypothetical protein
VAKAGRAIDKAADSKAGAYTSTVALAAEHGWAATETALDTLFARIKRDVKLATALGAEPRAKATEAGDKYKVPGSLSVVKSVLKAANEHNVDLLGEDGEARSFGAIRKDVRKAQAAAAEAAKTPDELIRDQVAEYLASIQASAASLTGDMLDALADSIAPIVVQAKAAAAAATAEAETAEAATAEAA